MSNTLDDSVFIEFFGFPASGKSTLCEGIQRQLSEEGISTTDTTRKIINKKGAYEGYLYMIGFALLTLLRHPITSVCFALLIKSSEQRSIEDGIRIWLYCLFLHALYRRLRTESSIHLLDQGMYQLLWSVTLTAESIDPSTLRAFIELFPLLDNHILIFTDIDENISLQRLADRNGNFSRVESLSGKQSLDRAELCRAAYKQVETIVNEHVASSRLSTVRVNTSDEAVEQSIDNIYPWIKKNCVK